jgi:peptidoglycan-associated lipoprotein
MWNRSMVSGGALIILGVALVFGGCSKKVEPVVSDTSAQDMSAKMREDEEAARRAREAAIAERERRMQEESMRRRMSEQQMAMTREEFINQDVRFDFDSYTLSTEAKSVLDKKAAWLRDNAGIANKIEGHCDERGTTAYNLALGERRANTAKQYVSALGISATRMATISYGEEYPIDPGHNEAAWAQNRRAHFTVSGQ